MSVNFSVVGSFDIFKGSLHASEWGKCGLVSQKARKKQRPFVIFLYFIVCLQDTPYFGVSSLMDSEL